MIKDGRFGIFLRIVFSLATVTPSATFAKDCIAKTEMAEIARDFPQFRNLAAADYCLDGSQTANLIESLMFMRKTRFDSIMPSGSDELFSGKFANDWYGYFKGRIDDIDIQSFCQKGVGAYVYSNGSTMYVCPMLLSANFTALDRSSVMMHEARHIDGYPHMTCRRGPREGLQGACDNRISDGGSYAVTVETYAQVARYAPDLNPALRAYAKASAVIYADEAFQTAVRVDRKAQFLVLNRDRAFHTIDVSQGFATQPLGQAPELGHVVMRGQHMILFPENKASLARYLFARNEGEIAQQAGDVALEYNSQSPTDRARLIDVHIGTQWVAQVFPDKIRFACDPRSETKRDVALTERPKALLYPNGYDRGAKVAQLQMDSGKVLDIGCNRGTAEVKASTLSLDRGFKKMYRSGTETLGLTEAGLLFRIQNGRSTPLATPFDGHIYELVPTQSYDFFDGSLIN